MFEHIESIVAVAVGLALSQVAGGPHGSLVAPDGQHWTASAHGAVRTVGSAEGHVNAKNWKPGEIWTLLSAWAEAPIRWRDVVERDALDRYHRDGAGVRVATIGGFNVAAGHVRVVEALFPGCLYEVPAQAWDRTRPNERKPIRVIWRRQIVGFIMGRA